MGEPNKIISISIPQSMAEWLDSDEGKNAVQNKSGLFQHAVKKVKHPQVKGKVSPLVFFVSIMGIAFSIVLIGIGITPTPMYQTTRAVLPLLAGILAICTILTYWKESKRASHD